VRQRPQCGGSHLIRYPFPPNSPLSAGVEALSVDASGFAKSAPMSTEPLARVTPVPGQSASVNSQAGRKGEDGPPSLPLIRRSAASSLTGCRPSARPDVICALRGQVSSQQRHPCAHQET